MEQPHRLFAYPTTPPRVPAGERHSYQRWFVTSHNNPSGAPFALLRRAYDLHAELSVEHSARGVRLDVTVQLTVAQLRDLATHLLRAADDIETHPAVDGAAS